MILADVSSGRSSLAISEPMNTDAPESATADTDSMGADPPEAAAASKPVVRTVMTFTGSRLCTVAMALPA